MVKFSKQLELQLVPEWKAAFCNYWQLKKDIKQISLHRKKLMDNDTASSVITRRRSDRWSHAEAILVRQRLDREGIYETQFLEPISQAEFEKAFFGRLDSQLNKVNEFYKTKETEYVERFGVLNKQFENLIRMRKILDQRRNNFPLYVEDEAAHEGLVINETEGITDYSYGETELGMIAANNAYLADTGCHISLESKNDEHIVEEKFYTHVDQQNLPNRGGEIYHDRQPTVSPQKLDIPKATPALRQMLWSDVMIQSNSCSPGWKDDPSISRKRLHYAEKMLRTAFIEFYRGLGLLRSFSSLNMIAFAKILKKYDKVTGRHASLTYIKVVESAYFQRSYKVVKMMDDVEKLFTESFANKDHKKAMTFLRPVQHKASHAITFFLGLFTGGSLAFLGAFIILLHIFGFYRDPERTLSGESLYLNSVYPVFSMMALILLHMYMYGWNLFMWRKVHINYAFIFEFSPKTELRYREVLLVCTGLSTIFIGVMLAHLAAHTGRMNSPNVDAIPMALIAVCLLLLFCPLNICYRSSRIFFLCSLKHVTLSPFYKVVMADFFLADQLTSQAPMLRNAEHTVCYYFGGHFKSYNTSACTGNEIHFSGFAYVISLLPYWWRLMQCLRRWIDEGDRIHIANGGKYLSAMVAAGARLAFLNKQKIGWSVVFVITSAISTIYQLYWDFVVDWGLLQPKSKNPWLRDQLILKRKYVYFISIGMDFILRFAWLQSVTHFQFGDLDPRVTDLIFASLEVVRRGHWNFYRLENEHLNNVGKFRAVKTVPLPFRDEDESEI